jgi:hypothetical protein
VTAGSDATSLLLSFSLLAPRLSSSPPAPQIPPPSPPSSSEGCLGGVEISKAAAASSALPIRWWWRPAVPRVAAAAGGCLGPQEVGGCRREAPANLLGEEVHVGKQANLDYTEVKVVV